MDGQRTLYDYPRKAVRMIYLSLFLIIFCAFAAGVCIDDSVGIAVYLSLLLANVFCFAHNFL